MEEVSGECPEDEEQECIEMIDQNKQSTSHVNEEPPNPEELFVQATKNCEVVKIPEQIPVKVKKKVTINLDLNKFDEFSRASSESGFN